MAKAYNPDAIWAPFGPFSQAVVIGSGRPVFLKGQVALDQRLQHVNVPRGVVVGRKTRIFKN